jgi:hypothetical protein
MAGSHAPMIDGHGSPKITQPAGDFYARVADGHRRVPKRHPRASSHPSRVSKNYPDR